MLRFRNSTADILHWIILFWGSGPVPCIADNAPGTHPIAVTTKNVAKHPQMSPREQNRSQLRITELDDILYYCGHEL